MSTMTEDKTYNGWANYPTWAVNLWLGNDEGLYNEVQEMTDRVLAETESRSEFLSLEDSHRVTLADHLKDYVEDLEISVVNRYTGDAATGDPTGYGADLYGWALAQVDWNEIAVTLISEREIDNS